MKREIRVLRGFFYVYYLPIIRMYNRYMYIWLSRPTLDWDSLVPDVISVPDRTRHLRSARPSGPAAIGLMNRLYQTQSGVNGMGSGAQSRCRTQILTLHHIFWKKKTFKKGKICALNRYIAHMYHTGIRLSTSPLKHP